jgi:hypothetical protein
MYRTLALVKVAWRELCIFWTPNKIWGSCKGRGGYFSSIFSVSSIVVFTFNFVLCSIGIIGTGTGNGGGGGSGGRNDILENRVSTNKKIYCCLISYGIL